MQELALVQYFVVVVVGHPPVIGFSRLTSCKLSTHLLLFYTLYLLFWVTKNEVIRSASSDDSKKMKKEQQI